MTVSSSLWGGGGGGAPRSPFPLPLPAPGAFPLPFHETVLAHPGSRCSLESGWATSGGRTAFFLLMLFWPILGVGASGAEAVEGTPTDRLLDALAPPRLTITAEARQSEAAGLSESFLESKVVPSDALTAGEDSSHARLLRGGVPLTEDLHDILRSLGVVVKPGTTTCVDHRSTTNSSVVEHRSSRGATTTSTTKTPTEKDVVFHRRNLDEFSTEEKTGEEFSTEEKTGEFSTEEKTGEEEFSTEEKTGEFSTEEKTGEEEFSTEEKTGEEEEDEELGYGSLGSSYCLSENILNPVAWRENDSEFHWRPEDDTSPGADLQAQCTDYYQHLPAYASRGWQQVVTKTGLTNEYKHVNNVGKGCCERCVPAQLKNFFSRECKSGLTCSDGGFCVAQTWKTEKLRQVKNILANPYTAGFGVTAGAMAATGTLVPAATTIARVAATTIARANMLFLSFWGWIHHEVDGGVVDQFVPKFEAGQMESCSICFSEWNPNAVPDDVHRLGCGHAFCHECISSWARHGSGLADSCPHCRRPHGGIPKVAGVAAAAAAAAREARSVLLGGARKLKSGRVAGALAAAAGVVAVGALGWNFVQKRINLFYQAWEERQRQPVDVENLLKKARRSTSHPNLDPEIAVLQQLTKEYEVLAMKIAEMEEKALHEGKSPSKVEGLLQDHLQLSEKVEVDPKESLLQTMAAQINSLKAAVWAVYDTTTTPVEQITDGYCKAENVVHVSVWKRNAPGDKLSLGSLFTKHWHPDQWYFADYSEGGGIRRRDRCGNSEGEEDLQCSVLLQQQCSAHYDTFFDHSGPLAEWAEQQKPLQGCCSTCVVGMVGQQGGSEKQCKNGLSCVSEKSAPGDMGFCVGQGFSSSMRRRLENTVALLPETSRLAILYLKDWIARAAPIIKGMLVHVDGALLADVAQNAQDNMGGAQNAQNADAQKRLPGSLLKMEQMEEEMERELKNQEQMEQMEEEMERELKNQGQQMGGDGGAKNNTEAVLSGKVP